MAYVFIILLAAGIFLYVAFRGSSTPRQGSDQEDDMETYNPVRGARDDTYARAGGTKNGVDD